LEGSPRLFSPPVVAASSCIDFDPFKNPSFEAYAVGTLSWSGAFLLLLLTPLQLAASYPPSHPPPQTLLSAREGFSLHILGVFLHPFL